MKFYFQPKTQAYKKWNEIMIGDRVLFNKGTPHIPATVRKIYYAGPKTCVAIEFDEPVPPIFFETHNCLGDVPSGNGYFIFIRPLIEKIIE